MPQLAILTPVLPALADHLPQTAENVQQAAELLRQDGWTLSWHVCIDGPGELELDDADADLLPLAVRAGVAAARNAALARAPAGAWVLPLDGDDLLDLAGLRALLADPALAEVGWASTNRALLDGRPAPFWQTEQPREWQPGQLAEQWVREFPFHPNSLLVRRELALEVGGWPALRSNEDLLFALLLGEAAAGVSLTHLVTRYRLWEGQTINAASREAWWAPMREVAYAVATATVNARRQAAGRPLILAPPTDGASSINQRLRDLAGPGAGEQ